MEESESLRAARAMRRAMLGDAYVDRVTADPDPVAAEFQDYVTSMAWGVWTREGALSTRDRSLLVMAMTAALGRMEEFVLHASSIAQTGVTDDELDELLFQIAAYCGAPAGVAARGGDPGRPRGTGSRLTVGTVGFVGLGNMGSVLAANLGETGHTVVAHDALGAQRAPAGTTHVPSVADVAQRAAGGRAQPPRRCRVGAGRS